MEFRNTTPALNRSNHVKLKEDFSEYSFHCSPWEQRIVQKFQLQVVIMASTPGQNVHLVVSSSHLVVSSLLLTSPLLVYYSVILQLVLSPFNSSCRSSTRRYLYIRLLGKRSLVISTISKGMSYSPEALSTRF